MTRKSDVVFVTTIVSLVMIIVGATATRASGQECSPSTLRSLAAQKVALTRAISRLRLGLAERDLDELADIASERGGGILQRTILSGASVLLSAPQVALQSAAPMGVSLPNGLGSLQPWKAQALIGRLQRASFFGGVPGLVPALRSLSRVNDKRGTLEFLEVQSRAIELLKSTAELEAARNSHDPWLESAEAFFGVAAAIAGKGALPVAVGNAIFNTGADYLELLILSKSVNSIENATGAQLAALSQLSKALNSNVKRIKACRTEVDASKRTAPKPATANGASSRTSDARARNEEIVRRETIGEPCIADSRVPLAPGQQSRIVPPKMPCSLSTELGSRRASLVASIHLRSLQARRPRFRLNRLSLPLRIFPHGTMCRHRKRSRWALSLVSPSVLGTSLRPTSVSHANSPGPVARRYSSADILQFRHLKIMRTI